MESYIKDIKRWNVIWLLGAILFLILDISILFSEEINIIRILLFLLCGYFILDIVQAIVRNKKTLENISEDTKLKYDDELKNVIFKTKENYIFTENYVFFFDIFNFEICRYDELFLVYKKLYFSKKGLRESYFIITKTGHKFEVVVWGYFPELNNKDMDFQKLLINKNPKILIDKTKENKKILKEKYNIKI